LLILSGEPPASVTGNLLLDRLLGAEVEWAGDEPLGAALARRVAQESATGRRPYPIPLGASVPLGAVAYTDAMAELQSQMKAQDVTFDRIIFATSSGGTQAGMVVGAALTGFAGKLIGVNVAKASGEEPLREIVRRLIPATAALVGHPSAAEDSTVEISEDYLGAGYAVMGAAEREAIELLARTEGILLDPVYTGRAAAGLIDMIRRGQIGREETVLFWHTGGAPALWAYADALSR
jgi:L-cysteate sulfo-lyase